MTEKMNHTYKQYQSESLTDNTCSSCPDVALHTFSKKFDTAVMTVLSVRSQTTMVTTSLTLSSPLATVLLITVVQKDTKY